MGCGGVVRWDGFLRCLVNSGFFGCVHISYFSLIVPYTIVINGQVSPNELPRKGGSNVYWMNIFYLALRWYTKSIRNSSECDVPYPICLNSARGFVFGWHNGLYE